MDDDQTPTRAFTLLELLVVVVVIAALAAIAIPRLTGVTRASSDRAAEASLRVALGTARTTHAATGTYTAADATSLTAELTGHTLLTATAPATAPGQISIHATATTWAAATWSPHTTTCHLWATTGSGTLTTARSRNTSSCTGLRASGLATGTFVPNDDIADAGPIDAMTTGGQTRTTSPIPTADATLETGETGAGTLGRTLWWTYTPTRTERVAITATISTGSGISLSLRTTGTVTGATTTTCTSGATTCTVTPTLTSGLTYWIQLNTTATGAPTATLTLTNPPTNDNIADAMPIDPLGEMSSWAGTYVNATLATVEPGEGSGRTVWWSYTPSFTGRLRFGLDFVGASLGHSTASVRTTPSVAATGITSCIIYGTSGSCHTPDFLVTAGQTLWLQFVTNAEGGSNWSIRPRVQTFTVPPANDNLADAALIPTQPPGLWTGTAVAATSARTEPGETALHFHIERTLWWSYTAGHTGQMTVGGSLSQAASSWSVVTVRGSASLTAPTITHCIGMSGCTTSSFSVVAGTTYYIQITSPDPPTAGALTMTPQVRVL